MSKFEVPFRLEGEYDEVLLLDKYNDEYGIVLAQESRDGSVYKRWCYPQRRDRQKKDNVPAEKAIPWRVRLGDRKQALTILKGMVAALEGHADNLAKKDDIPF